MVSLPALITALGMAESNSKAKQLVLAGAVSVEGTKLTELKASVDQLASKILKVGKLQNR